MRANSAIFDADITWILGTLTALLVVSSRDSKLGTKLSGVLVQRVQDLLIGDLDREPDQHQPPSQAEGLTFKQHGRRPMGDGMGQ